MCHNFLNFKLSNIIQLKCMQTEEDMYTKVLEVLNELYNDINDENKEIIFKAQEPQREQFVKQLILCALLYSGLYFQKTNTKEMDRNKYFTLLCEAFNDPKALKDFDEDKLIYVKQILKKNEDFFDKNFKKDKSNSPNDLIKWLLGIYSISTTIVIGVWWFKLQDNSKI
jgi:hypothetical protein